jgi:hypothetical protein
MGHFVWQYNLGDSCNLVARVLKCSMVCVVPNDGCEMFVMLVTSNTDKGSV